jgi:hypothetical protein
MLCQVRESLSELISRTILNADLYYISIPVLVDFDFNSTVLEVSFTASSVGFINYVHTHPCSAKGFS